MEQFWVNYTGSCAERDDPLVMPIKAEMYGLPPTFLTIAECDILADGNRAMAKKLEAAGVAVDARVYRGATHSFLEAVSIAPLAARALDDAAGWLRATLT
jgi:acetyl esterase